MFLACQLHRVPKAALEIAAHKASTSVGMAHTAANAWRSKPTLQSAGTGGRCPAAYGLLLPRRRFVEYVRYQPVHFGTDPNGYPTLQSSVSGIGDYVVTGFTVDYFANPNGFTDPVAHPTAIWHGRHPEYPSITVTGTGLTLNPDADNNLPDINLPVGEVDDITFVLIRPSPMALINSADDGEPNVTVDQYFFQLNLTGPENPTLVPYR